MLMQTDMLTFYENVTRKLHFMFNFYVRITLEIAYMLH